MTLNNNKHFAEVIESSLQGFKAQCWQWDKPPAFGSLVTIELSSRTLFGIVYHTQMGSMDPLRYPFPYQKTEEELMQEQPQIFSFLKTILSCLIVGYREKGTMQYTIAPEPPKIHAFVGHASTELSKEFFSRNNYLHLIFANQQLLTHVDELLLAIFKQQIALDCLSDIKLNNFIETFSLLSGNDYRRLKLFLQRAEPLIHNQNG